jgi:hypothetical protein
MKIVRKVRLAAVAVCFAMLAAGPVSADGLARFEKSIKPQIPADAFTYKSSKTLGDNGFADRQGQQGPAAADQH